MLSTYVSVPGFSALPPRPTVTASRTVASARVGGSPDMRLSAFPRVYPIEQVHTQ